MSRRSFGVVLALGAVGLGLPCRPLRAQEAVPLLGDGVSQVVGGDPVATGTHPETAAVLNGSFAFCTGTLIAPDVVLTAGHCIGRTITHVALGWTDTAAAPAETIAVASKLSYPGWQSTYDVGILFLASPSGLPPARLAIGCAPGAYLVDGAPATIVGWGAIDSSGTTYPTRLMSAELTVTDADCGAAGLGCEPAVSPGGELVAGGGGVDTCFGDSGGPLFLAGGPRALLAGVTSRAQDGWSVPCGDGGIYVRVDAVVAWLETQTGYDFPLPLCDPAWIFDDGFELGTTSSWSLAAP